MRTLRGVVQVLIAAAAAFLTAGCGPPQAPPTTPAPKTLFVTGNQLEVDRLASMWLIARFIDTNATFHFIPDGTPVTQGIPFDTPESEFRRQARLSCYETILRKYGLTDPRLVHVGELVHDVEINFWGEKRLAQTAKFEARIRQVIQEHTNNPTAATAAAFAVLDGYYAEKSR